MIFQQLACPRTGDLSYLLASPESGVAAAVDPAPDAVARILHALAEHELRLQYTLETHAGVGPARGAEMLRRETGCRRVAPVDAPLGRVDLRVGDGDEIHVGALRLDVLGSPGHATCEVAYVLGDRVLTGRLLEEPPVSGAADPARRALRERVLALPAHTLLYPTRSARGARVSLVALEQPPERRAVRPARRAGGTQAFAADA